MAEGLESRLSPLFGGLLGGLALFLYGLDLLSDALKAVAGGRMKDILSRLTTNRFTAVLTGAFVTAVVQSSSVTTVLVVGFVTANLMTMAQSIGVIMGANIGTTVTNTLASLGFLRRSKEFRLAFETPPPPSAMPTRGARGRRSQAARKALAPAKDIPNKVAVRRNSRRETLPWR